MTGIIEKYRPKYGYGFLLDDNGNQYYFNVARNLTWETGDKVTFDSFREEEKGLVAIGVKIVE